MARWGSLVVKLKKHISPSLFLTPVTTHPPTLRSSSGPVHDDLDVVKDACDRGGIAVVERVRGLKRLPDIGEDGLEGALGRFDELAGHLEDDGAYERAMKFRMSVVDERGQVVWLDAREAMAMAKVDDVLRRHGGGGESVDDALDKVISHVGTVVASVKLELSLAAEDLGRAEAALDETGLTGAVQHYRILRENRRREEEVGEQLGA